MAQFTAVGTGAWEFTDSVTGQNWNFDAVEDHYRKTPNFAKLVMLQVNLVERLGRGALTVGAPLLFCSWLSCRQHTARAFWRPTHDIGPEPKFQ